MDYRRDLLPVDKAVGLTGICTYKEAWDAARTASQTELDRIRGLLESVHKAASEAKEKLSEALPTPLVAAAKKRRTETGAEVTPPAW